MSSVPMKFKGFEWHHNPKEISFECDKTVNELSSPFLKSYIQSTGRKNMRILGSGELYGTDCMRQFARLFELFAKGGAGVLSIPDLPAFFAVFESLKITAQPKPDILCYSFAFREVMEKKSDDKPSFCTMGEGETLWDISYLKGVSIDALMRLNPAFKRPDECAQAARVILC